MVDEDGFDLCNAEFFLPFLSESVRQPKRSAQMERCTIAGVTWSCCGRLIG
ncbi:MAG: hypothetical protein ACLR8P_19305 [Clostridium fessum]